MKIMNLKTITLIIFTIILSKNITYSQWKKCTGKYNDLVVCNFIQLDNTIYGSTKEGIITSEDGLNWDNIIGFPFPIDKLYNYDNIIFGVYGYNNLKVTYSKDYGETWKMLNTDTLNNFTQNLHSLLYDRGSIFLATPKGIFKTNDWGISWQLINNKILGNHVIHTQLVKVKEDYFALDRNKNLYISKDHGRTWKLITENKNLWPIFLHNNSLFGLINDKFLYKLNDRLTWIKHFEINLGYVSTIKPFCCNGIITSSDKNRIIFNDENIIELPKIPVDTKYDLLEDVFVGKDFIIASTNKGGLWYIPFSFKIQFE